MVSLEIIPFIDGSALSHPAATTLCLTLLLQETPRQIFLILTTDVFRENKTFGFTVNDLTVPSKEKKRKEKEKKKQVKCILKFIKINIRKPFCDFFSWWNNRTRTGSLDFFLQLAMIECERLGVVQGSVCVELICSPKMNFLCGLQPATTPKTY